MLYLYLAMLDNENDKREFEKIYYKYKDKMYKIAFSILHNDADVQEAVSEAFYKIAKNFKEISENGINLEISVVIIIRSISLNYYKHNKRRSLKERHIEPIDEERFCDEFESNRIVEEILELPEKIRDAMYLKYVYGLSVKEIAKLQNCSTAIIYKRVEKGKEIIKENLKGCINHE